MDEILPTSLYYFLGDKCILQYNLICTECGKKYYKTDGSEDLYSPCCDAYGKPVENKYIMQAQERARREVLKLEQQNQLLRSRDYPHFFGRKTFKI